MQLAMGITAFLCIFIGVYPDTLYALLPYDVEYHPYTMAHVVGQLQLLCFALLAFAVLMRSGIHPPEIHAVNLDVDWIYRRLLPRLLGGVSQGLSQAWANLSSNVQLGLSRIVAILFQLYGPNTGVAKVLPTGSMVVWIAILLGLVLVVNYI